MIDPKFPVTDVKRGMENTKRAWERVVIERRAPETEVRSMILRSWRRGLAIGLDPMSEMPPPSLSRPELNALIEENSEIIKISKPVMQMIELMTKDTGFVVSLSEKTGYVLLVMGDDEVLEMAVINQYLPGCRRTLDQAGTNSIGLCLAEGRPIQVNGAEHYKISHHQWTCSSAPIFDAMGSILGVITLSGKITCWHQHTLGLVTSAAETIETQLRERHLINEKDRLNAMLASINNSITDGVIALDKDGIVSRINHSAAVMLGVREEDVTERPVAESLCPNRSLLQAIESRKYRSSMEMSFGEKGRRKNFIGRIDPIYNAGGHDSGAILVFSQERDVINIAKRIGGNYAQYRFKDIKGRAPVLLEQIEVAQKAARTDSRMLIVGESGTGKEMFAQAAHNHSRRANEPFVAISCAAIPRDLIESELFGYRGGAFTGARREGMVGKFEMAHKGTLFLDEINGLPQDMQVKLLRVLQQNEIMRLGDTRTISVDVRIIAASNADLLSEVENSNFRKDLYYRLSTVEIFVPPLRDRIVDLEILVEHIIERQALKTGVKTPKISDEVMETLKNYDWPGNIRELENTIERAVLLCQGGVITKELLPARITSESRRQRPQSFQQSYRQVVERALAKCGGNISAAARELNISRSTLYRKIKDFELSIPV